MPIKINLNFSVLTTKNALFMRGMPTSSSYFCTIHIFYRLTPICVASIISSKIALVPDLWKTLEQLGLFIVISISGFLLYQLVIAQAIYFLIVRKNPFKYYVGIMPAIMTGFATASK